MNRVFYLGQPGSFSERAARECFPKHKKIGLNSFGAIFEQLNKQPGTVAVVPIENSLAGVVEEVEILLKRHLVRILGEYPLSIELCLAAKEKLQLKQIKRIYSHPKALQQIKKLLETLSGVETVACQDTASAALTVAKESVQEGSAALISPWCATMYGLQVIQEAVADQAPNITRFLMISGVKLMDSIEQLRLQIDKLDETIAKALLERLAVSQAIGIYKEHEIMPIADSGREKAVLEHLYKFCSNEIEREMIAHIYAAIFSYSKEVQKRKSDE